MDIVIQRIEEARANSATHLDLSGLCLSKIPEEVLSLGFLESLDVSCNSISELPNDIKKLTKLKEFIVYNNKLKTLPEHLFECRSLKTVSAAFNNIEDIEVRAGAGSRVTQIYLLSNGIRDVPEGIYNLNNLLSLDLSQNHISKIGCKAEQLLRLLWLDLSGNEFSEFDKNICLISSLRGLSLNDNLIEYIPNEIKFLKKIELLFINNNKLSSIPPVIGTLKSLLVLYLRYNNIEKVAEDIGNLKCLNILDLNSNKIRRLPDEIGGLESLYSLNLKGNEIGQFPSKIGNLTNLKRLLYSEDDVEDLPKEVMKRGLSTILNYYRAVSDSRTEYVYEAKLIIVGEGCVGKTSIRKALTSHEYVNGDIDSTEGIDITSWVINSSETGLINDFKFNVWDFGGQEIYHSTHQFFFTKRSLYILVTESRREDKQDEFYYWLNIISLLGERSPVILLLNKCDQPLKELPIREFRNDFPNIVEYDKTSCLKDYKHTIDSLRSKIVKIVSDSDLLPDVGISLPVTWVYVKDDIDSYRKAGAKYIGYDEYFCITDKYKMSRDAAIDLCEFYHDTGVFLHFTNDIVLNNIIFLDHEWVTAGVYDILDCKSIIEKQGQFNIHDLQDLWSETQYDKVSSELLALMKKFNLCYSLGDGEYLAPQLLPVDTISEFVPPNHQDCLNFEYEYSFMPKGLLSLFIVSLHNDIVVKNGKRLHWRYGAILHFEGATAYVRERIFHSKITISITGDNRNEFLSIIRKTFAGIHRRFHKLQFNEMVPCNCKACLSGKPFYFNYAKIRRMISVGITQDRCGNSLDLVDLKPLIANIIQKFFDDMGNKNTNQISNSDNVSINLNVNQVQNLNNKNDINIKFNIDIYSYQQLLDDLKEESECLSDNTKRKIREVSDTFDELSNKSTEEHLNKPFNKLHRLLKRLGDENSEECKTIKGTKKLFNTVKQLIEKYKLVSSQLGLPPISDLFF